MHPNASILARFYKKIGCFSFDINKQKHPIIG